MSDTGGAAAGLFFDCLLGAAVDVCDLLFDGVSCCCGVARRALMVSFNNYRLRPSAQIRTRFYY
jgi:hypothetical protein